jgi:hypothetical protein
MAPVVFGYLLLVLWVRSYWCGEMMPGALEPAAT